MSDLKIVSYNIYDGLLEQNIASNVFNFAQKGANLICLQEVRPAAAGKRFIGDVLLEKLGPDWKGEFVLSTEATSSDNGLGILWNQKELELIKFQSLQFAKLKKINFIEYLVQLSQNKEGKPIQRGALIGEFKIQNKKVRVSNVHLDWQGKLAHHTGQLRQLLNHMKTLAPADAEIICGDFNTIGLFGYGRRLQQFTTLLGEDFISIFPEFKYTTTHYQHLDHAFVKNLKINQAEIFTLPGSDHYPIMSSLSFS